MFRLLLKRWLMFSGNQLGDILLGLLAWIGILIISIVSFVLVISHA